MRPHALADGLRLAITTFTVVPARTGRIDRAAATVAMSLAAGVGVALGVATGGLGLLMRYADAPLPLAAVAVVAAWALLTRGLHLDGLADTVDALGSYAGKERALEIMKRPDVGPFGVAALVLVLLAQVTAITRVLERSPVAVLAGLAVAAGTGRAAATWACRRGVPAARPGGLGALVAGTVPPLAALTATVVLAAGALLAVPERPWLGPVAVVVALGVVALLLRHARRRLGGVTGDLLGAAVEVATTITLVGFALSP